MRKMERLFLLTLIALICTAANGCAKERSAWRPSQPVKQEFESILKAQWEQESDKASRWDSSKWSKNIRTRCVAVPLYPVPDQSSQSNMPFAWHIDFAEGGTVREVRARQLKQLDMLVRAGLLQKSTADVEKDGAKVKGVRYGITLAGWKMAATDRGPFCFMYGTPRFLGVKEISAGLINAQAGLEVYTITAKSGLEKGDLEEWAHDEEVQAAFPDIKRLLDGEEQKRQFIRGGGGWIPYECLQTIVMRKEYARICDSPGGDSKAVSGKRSGSETDDLLLERDKFVSMFAGEFSAQLDKAQVADREKEEAVQYMNSLKSAAPPTEEEIKNLIRKEYEVGGATAEFMGMKLYFDKGYRFKYRVFLSYKSPAGSALTSDILAYREDLRIMIEHGRACAGDFGFDVKTRGRQAGSGTCWDAVDTTTVAENLASAKRKDEVRAGEAELGSKSCNFSGVIFPENVRVYAADGNSGRKLNYQIDQSGHTAMQIDVTVNSPSRSPVLFLGAYEPTIWNIQWTPGTRIVAVMASGYHRQVVAGLPNSVPVQISTYDNKRPCGYFHTVGQDPSALSARSKQLVGHSIDEVTMAKDGVVVMGEAIPKDMKMETSLDTPPESYFDRNAPLAGPAAIADAVAKGILRRANNADGKAWEQAMLEKNPGEKVTVNSTHAYVVLKEFVYPAGLFGANAAVFFVPKGVPAPIGNPGHSIVYDSNTLRCQGPLC